MENLRRVLSRITIPSMVPMIRHIHDDSVKDVVKETTEALERSGIAANIDPGMRVAVAVGSRGIANISVLVRASVSWLRAKGAEPFIVPAMGSHGQATAEGQRSLLADLGVTEESAMCPVRASMDVVKLGELPNGLGVYFDRVAYEEADAVFVINRVKPHTNFRGKWESGIVKMLTIGLGKQIGADSCHTYGFSTMAENVPAMAEISLEKVNILGGVAVVENAMDQTCLIEAVRPERFLERDAALLEFARTCMPSLPIETLDILIVDEMGKNISGAGMDPNVIGRCSVSGVIFSPVINRIVVLDLTEESHGNAIGMGLADFITFRFKEKIDYEAAYINSMTATTTKGAFMPMAFPSDFDAIRGAIKTSNVTDMKKLRMMRIKNTLEMTHLGVTPNMVDELRQQGCEVDGPEASLEFSPDGTLMPA